MQCRGGAVSRNETRYRELSEGHGLISPNATIDRVLDKDSRLMEPVWIH